MESTLRSNEISKLVLRKVFNKNNTLKNSLSCIKNFQIILIKRLFEIYDLKVIEAYTLVWRPRTIMEAVTQIKALRYDSNGNLRETMNERDKTRNERDWKRD